MVRAVPWLMVLAGCGSTVTLGSGPGGEGGDAGGGGGGGLGGAPVTPICELGATQTCYEGPEGTAEVGLCRAGQRTCLDDGSGFGACEGMVLPQLEICDDDVDQDCDGWRGCVPTSTWALGALGEGDQVVHDLAVDDAGVVFVGSMEGSVSFGADPITSAGLSDAFVARLSHGGSDLYSRRFGGEGQDVATAVGSDGASALVVGLVEGEIAFGDDKSAGDRDFFALRLDGTGSATGAQRWLSPGDELGWLRASSGAGGVIGGHHDTGLPLGGSPLPAPPVASAVVASLDESLGAPWATTGSGEVGGEALGSGVLDVVQAEGVVVAGGWSDGGLVLGGSATAVSEGHGFVAVLNAQGEVQSVRVITGPGTRVTGVAVAEGTIAAVGRRPPESDRPGLFIALMPLAGVFPPVLFELGGGDVGSPRVDASPQGFFVGGRISAPMIDGDRPFLTDPVGYDAFLLEIDVRGGIRWATQFGDAADAQVTALGRGPLGELYMGGDYAGGSVSLGAVGFVNEGGRDAFMVRLDPPR